MGIQKLISRTGQMQEYSSHCVASYYSLSSKKAKVNFLLKEKKRVKSYIMLHLCLPCHFFEEKIMKMLYVIVSENKL